MKTRQHLFCYALMAAMGSSMVWGQGERDVRDNVGFCWNLDQMERLVSYLEQEDTVAAAPEPIVAAISPHDDYLYAGRIYEPLFRRLRSKEAVIFGVTHRTVRMEIGDPEGVLLLDDFQTWRGVRGPVPISPLREVIEKRLDRKYFLVSNKAQGLEHSIEALVPFLQYYNPDVAITPIMVTAMPFERMQEISEALAGIIAGYARERKLTLGKDLVILISSDANHYGADFDNKPFGDDEAAHEKGTRGDRVIARDYLTGGVAESKVRDFTVAMDKVVWCGRYSIPFGLLTAEKVCREVEGKNLKGSVLTYSDTYSEGALPLRKTGMGTTAPFSLKHWVGFLSAVFTPK